MKRFLLVLIICCCFYNVNAQDNCCGLGTIMGMLAQTGVSGGYGLQMYNAQGFNHYIDSYNNNHPDLTTKMSHFEKAMGYRLGLNIAQFLVNKWVFGLKFQYQWTKEKNTSANASREYELNLTQLGIGFTLSYYLGRNFDLKILDLMATSNNVSLTNRYKEANISNEQKLKNPSSTIGINAGAGFVAYIIPPYVAIETTAGYSFFRFNSLDFENGGTLAREEASNEPMSDFIKLGGFFAFAQLNLAIPF